MVPPADPSQAAGDEPALAVKVEPYDYLPVDKAAFKGPIPSYRKLVPYEPFHFYLERKLYIHNMAHVTTAFLGKRGGSMYISEAAERIPIQKIVLGCMTESALALNRKYGIAFKELYDHMEDLLYRFQNPYLKDPVFRVARDPMRKLQPSDRLVGAARNCEEQDVVPVYIAFAIALALSEMENIQFDDFIREVCKIEKGEELYRIVWQFYQMICEGKKSLEEMVLEIEKNQALNRREVV